MTILEREGGFLVRETKLLCFRPELDNISRRHSWSNCMNRHIQNIPTVFIGIDQCRGRAPYRKGAVITGAVAVVAMENIEICRVAGS